MFTPPDLQSTRPAGFALKRVFAVLSIVIALVMVGVLFNRIHDAAELAIHRVGASAAAMHAARLSLAESFLELSLHEDDVDPAYAARALVRLGAVSGQVGRAVDSLQTVGAERTLSDQLVAFRNRIDGLGATSFAPTRTDEHLSVAYAQLAPEAARLDAMVQALADTANKRLDTLFVRSVAGLAFLFTVVVSIVLLASAAHGRSSRAHRRAEDESHRQSKLLNAIAEGTADAVFVKDRDGRYLYANRATADFVGRPVGELLGKDDSALFDLADADGLRRHDAALMEGNRSETAEETLTAAGVTRTYLVTKGPLHDETGAVVGLIGVSCDITARKRDEQALRESEKRLELALTAARMGVWSVDLRTRAVFWSREVFEMTGLSSPPSSMNELLEHVLPADREAAAAAYEAALQRPERFDLSVRSRRPDGEIRWFALAGEVQCDAAGEPLSLQGVASDVTDRMRTEEALRTSEERYRRFLDVLPDAVFVMENDCLAYCNPAYVALRGATVPSEVIGTSVFAMFSEDVHQSVRDRVDELLTTGRPLSPIERRLIRFDGRSVPVLVTGTQVIDPSRRAVLVVLRDLTRQHHAEAWAQSILSHTQDGIISTDQFGTITSFNAAAEQSFGYTAAEVLGCHIAQLVPSSRPTDVGRRREMEVRRKDGTSLEVDVAVSAFELDGERHIIAVARDISERRKLEADLRQAHKMEALGQVAGGVAHDFNNLLTVILGYSDMLQDQFPEGDPRRQFASDIRRASGRAADLTRQLLTFSRRTVAAPKIVDVNVVVKDMNRMLRRVLGEDVELVVAVEENVRAVFIDPGSLEQIVMNLCVNARDAMPGGGCLTISTGHAYCQAGLDATGRPIPVAEYVRVTVTDTGEGIPPEVRAHIFEPFFTTKGVGKGTGLGLAVVLGLVEQNGGHIHLDTAPGTGTSFIIALPVVDGVVAAAPDAPARVPRGSGETVLVVEDEEPVRRLAVIALASAGYRVLEAPDGRAAIGVFDQQRGQVDLLITDVVMPHVGGRELATALVAKQPSLRVIYTSGYADDAVLRHGISRADVVFLAKPYTPSGLLQKVHDVLDPLRR